MSELQPQPADVFALPYAELVDSTRAIKSTSPEVVQASAIMHEEHPSLEAILHRQLGEYSSGEPGFYTPDSFAGFINGFAMGYATYRHVAASRDSALPRDPGQTVAEEWVLSVNQQLGNKEWVRNNLETAIETSTSIPTFRERMPGWYETGARALGRTLSMPHTQFMDFRDTVHTLTTAKLHGSQVIDTRPLEYGFYFLHGYGRVLLALQALDTNDRLPQL